MFPAAVVTVSDSCFEGRRQDESGPAVAQRLRAAGFAVDEPFTVPDEQAAIEDALRRLCCTRRLVVTTGGTGIAPRDVTPEATRNVCSRIVEGIGERMRAAGVEQSAFAPLSRAVCGICGTSLVLNLPGSPRGALASLESVLPLLPHALALVDGETQHPEPGPGRRPRSSTPDHAQ